MVFHNVMKNPIQYVIYILGWLIQGSVKADKRYLKMLYRYKTGEKLNVDNPQTFNEKLQWLKLYDRKSEYTKMVDKYEVRKIIAKEIGEEYLVPLVGVWDKFENIDFSKLPDKFVLKCTHDSGGLSICADKSTFNIKKAQKKINHCMRRNYYNNTREWPYKNVKPRIIAEEYMVDESGWELKDYKIFCFNGKAEYIEVDFNRYVKHKLNTYDFDWNPLNFCDSSKSDYKANIPKPKKLTEMKEIAERLSKNMDFLRVDFYSIDNHIYVGELTLCPGSGFIAFDPKDRDLYYGKKLNLSNFQEVKINN